MHHHADYGQWASEILQCSAHTAKGRRVLQIVHWSTHCLWAVGGGNLAMHHHTACGRREVQIPQWKLCNSSHGMGPVGSEIVAMHRHKFGDSGQCNSYTALPHCLWALGRLMPAMHFPTASR